MLKQEAAEKKFPDNELLQRLNTVLTDTQHCQKTSTDLLSNPQTRLLTHTHTLSKVSQPPSAHAAIAAPPSDAQGLTGRCVVLFQ